MGRCGGFGGGASAMLLRAVLCSSCGSDSGVCVEGHRRIRSTLVVGRASTRMAGRPMARCALFGGKAGRAAFAEFPAGNSGRKVHPAADICV